ncbi:hypothetical protein ABUK73_20455 [Agrobacterium sp. BA1120]|uniref:hypothetical protein n=1 Tax=Agrobacterium sp. BA1120 TaxID=3228927 RepID=UPI00336A1DE6
MSTRSTFVFEISPYPGRDNPPMVRFHLYKHDDTEPYLLQSTVLHHWKTARQQIAGDMNSYRHHPQISLCQALMGLMLADAQREFRIADGISDDSEYLYLFQHVATDADELHLTITDRYSKKVLFDGDYPEYAMKFFPEETGVVD